MSSVYRERRNSEQSARTNSSMTAEVLGIGRSGFAFRGRRGDEDPPFDEAKPIE